MKKLNLLAVVALLLSLTACNKENPSNEDGDKNLVVQLAGIMDTRATTPGELVTSQTQNINGVSIYLTDATDNVSMIKSVTRDNTAGSEWAQLTNTQSGGGLKIINVEKNTSKVYVFANTNASNLQGSTEPIKLLATTIPLQVGSAVLYSGVDSDLRPVQTEPINPDPTLGQTYTAQVSIAPVVARMQIKSVTFQPRGQTTVTKNVNGTDETANVTWQNFSGTLKGVYFNNFYYDYSLVNKAMNLYHNTFYSTTLHGGQWIFNGTDHAEQYASYNYYTTSYQDLPLNPGATNQSYGFNFFPGAEIPTIHLDVDAAVANPATDIQSDNTNIFNPSLTGQRFANIVKYFDANGNQMTTADFKAGHVYNMDVTITPVLDVDISSVQYNVLVTVTVLPWVEQTVTPGFDYEN